MSARGRFQSPRGLQYRTVQIEHLNQTAARVREQQRAELVRLSGSVSDARRRQREHWERVLDGWRARFDASPDQEHLAPLFEEAARAGADQSQLRAILKPPNGSVGDAIVRAIYLADIEQAISALEALLEPAGLRELTATKSQIEKLIAALQDDRKRFSIEGEPLGLGTGRGRSRVPPPDKARAFYDLRSAAFITERALKVYHHLQQRIPASRRRGRGAVPEAGVVSYNQQAGSLAARLTSAVYAAYLKEPLKPGDLFSRLQSRRVISRTARNKQ